MREVLRAFGALAGLGGTIMAAVLFFTAFTRGEPITLNVALVAAAWLLGGLFWAALCVTVAQMHEMIEQVRAEARGVTPVEPPGAAARRLSARQP